MPVSRLDKALGRARAAIESFLKSDNDGVPGAEHAPGALPGFVVVGTQKGGTTFLYDLLTRHPHVEPVLARNPPVAPVDEKELHYFDFGFDKGMDWYRACFPPPDRRDGRDIVTGEATPYYLFHPHAARRMAGTVPHVKTIVLLRNPVDRAYSHHQMEVGKGFESLSFEEALEAEEARLSGEQARMLEDEHYVSFAHQHFSYLSRGVYVDQLKRWSRFFPEEQMLVLKSEDFFESPMKTLGTAVDFLGLPEREPEAPGSFDERRNEGKYGRGMDPKTKRRLEEYFGPHNRRLYDYLGRDFGW